jgi:hypothetical protein
MKKVLTLLACTLCFIAGVAQTDLVETNGQIDPSGVERTPELIALYNQSKQLEQSGTPAEIHANRLAIKDAWQEVNPEIAALYRPVDNQGRLPETLENLDVNGIYYPKVIKERLPEPQNRDWDTDRLLLDDFVDGGVDIEVTLAGDIYISAYQNNIDFGGTFDFLFIYRSTNGGSSFQQWQMTSITAPMRKMQIISLDGTGTEYINAYFVTDSGNFQVIRYDVASGNLDDAEVIATDVIDFSVDRNYLAANTNSYNVMATYQKDTSCSEVHSARSLANYGFGWVDEFTLGLCGLQTDFAYGRSGSCYTTFVGASTGNLYALANTTNNDPASWSAQETVELGSNRETLNPSIAAARLTIASDKVIIWASDRAAGSTDEYDGVGYLRENMGAFAVFSNFGSGGPNWNVAHTDKWVRRANGAEVIRTAYVRDNIDDTEADRNRSLTFNGTGFDPLESVADPTTVVFDGFPSATSETNDDLPCMAFAGTSGSGLYGYGLYFDAKAVIILDTQENAIDGLSYYPNPVTNELHISAANTIESVTLYNMLGQEVSRITPNEIRAELNMSSLSTGMYVMQIGSNGQSGTYKILKQ